MGVARAGPGARAGCGHVGLARPCGEVLPSQAKRRQFPTRAGEHEPRGWHTAGSWGQGQTRWELQGGLKTRCAMVGGSGGGKGEVETMVRGAAAGAAPRLPAASPWPAQPSPSKPQLDPPAPFCQRRSCAREQRPVWATVPGHSPCWSYRGWLREGLTGAYSVLLFSSCLPGLRGKRKACYFSCWLQALHKPLALGSRSAAGSWAFFLQFWFDFISHLEPPRFLYPTFQHKMFLQGEYLQKMLRKFNKVVS